MKEIEELEKKGYEYHMDGDKIIITHDGDIQLDLTSIDTKLVFKNDGGVSMNALTTVDVELVFRNGYSVWMNALTTVDVELVFSNGGSVWMDALTTVDVELVFRNGGDVSMNALTSVGAKLVFRNGYSVWMNALTTVDVELVFRNGSSVWMDALTSVDVELVFKNGGSVLMNALTSVGAKLVFKNDGGVWMNALTTVDVELVFRNDGSVWMDAMTSINHIGEKLDLKLVDGYTMVILSTKHIGDYLIHKSKYFQGRKLEDMDGCFVVEKDGLFAHGETIKKAIEDLKFKVLSKTLNVDDLVSEIKEKGTINKNDFRLLTGACSFGVDKFLKKKGIKEYEVSIEEVVKITKGEYGHEMIVELLG